MSNIQTLHFTSIFSAIYFIESKSIFAHFNCSHVRAFLYNDNANIMDIKVVLYIYAYILSVLNLLGSIVQYVIASITTFCHSQEDKFQKLSI